MHFAFRFHEIHHVHMLHDVNKHGHNVNNQGIMVTTSLNNL